MALVLYAVYTFLAAYNAGNMTSLQMQHYSIYRYVGKENFQKYIGANNRAAFVPAMVPGLLMHILSVILILYRPYFMTTAEAIASLILNVIGFISTLKWQRPLQAEMVHSEYNEEKVRLLISTNWIRTVAFLLLGGLTIYILVATLK